MPPVALLLPPSPLVERPCEVVATHNAAAAKCPDVSRRASATSTTNASSTDASSKDFDMPTTTSVTRSGSSTSSLTSQTSETQLASTTDTSSSQATKSVPQHCRSCLKIKTQSESLAAELCSPYVRSRHRRYRNRVRFSEIHIRSFPPCLGDNPSVRGGGVPLALDYSVPPVVRLDGLDDYERQRRKQRKSSPEALRLSKQERRQRLVQRGLHPFTDGELRTLQYRVRVQQLQRQWTYQTRGLEPIQETVEWAAKAVKNATWNRRRKVKEQEWLAVYRSNNQNNNEKNQSSSPAAQ